MLEGPDGCGKTNIAKAIASHYRLPYFKVPTEKKNWVDDTFMQSIPFDVLLPEFVSQTGVGFVSDRCYASEIVYSEVFGRNTDIRSLWKIDERWSDLGAIIIVAMRRDYSVVCDEFVEREKLDFLHVVYDSFYMKTSCDAIKIYVDDFDDDIDLQLPFLIERIDALSDDRRNVDV